MSRTHHHSRRWGKDHRWSSRPDRRRGFLRGRIGEAPGWHVRMHENRPGRRADRLLIHRIVRTYVDVEEACFERTGGRKPHAYYW